jgi:spore germination protein GerM
VSRHGRAVLAALLVASAAAGCSRQSDPVEIDPAELPFSLTRSPSVTAPAGAEDAFTAYFVQDGRLVPVTRPSVGEASPAVALRALVVGPAIDEQEAGIRSFVPAQTTVLEVSVFDQIAEVDLSAEFQGPAPPDVILLRVAQVVWTLVSRPGITAVRFVIDGQPVSVPTDRGTPIDRPVTAPDYASVAPISTPPTEPTPPP